MGAVDIVLNRFETRIGFPDHLFADQTGTVPRNQHRMVGIKNLKKIDTRALPR